MMRSPLQAVFHSYAEIFFLQSRVLGVAIFLVMLIEPNVALGGMLSVVGAYGFARLIRMGREFLSSGFYTYNPLLVGLAAGYMFRITPLVALLVVMAGVLAFVATTLIANVLTVYFKLPILSLPFAVVRSLIYLASLRYGNVLAPAVHGHGLLRGDFGAGMPFWMVGYLKAFGAILCMPNVVAGGLLCLFVLASSRILFLLSVLGYVVGATVRMLMLGSAVQAFADVHNFNFILIAMAVGGVFLVPSLSSYLLAMIAVAVSTVLMDAIVALWSLHGIPAFTLPFNLVSMSVIYVLGIVGYPMIVTRFGRTPEETLENHLANQLRYTGQERTLYLPFSGTWTVWQAFDGQWTHKGAWRYAYDFVITDSDDKTHGGDGDKLEDYYCFGKPVLSPVRGHVVRVVDDLPDNPPGEVEKGSNWGNAVIMQDLRGCFVGISHFACASIKVKPGDWVERGTVLGLCGNSGYSPQPHIHIQAQLTDAVGANSVPYSLASYAESGRYHANELPAEKQRVEPLFPDKYLDGAMTFLLDEVQEYDVLRGDTVVDRLTATVKMAIDGTLYLQSDHGVLYFGKHEGTFYFYRLEGDDPWLRAIFLALPRLPLAHREKLAWHDYVPVGLATSGVRRMLVRFLSSFYPDLARVEVMQAFEGQRRVRSEIAPRFLGARRVAEVELDPSKGFKSIRIDGIELRRTGNGQGA